jgi:hypothetical protein
VKKFLMRLLIFVAAISFGACGNPLMDFTGDTDSPGGDGPFDPDTTGAHVKPSITPIYIDTQDEFNRFCKIGESGNDDYPLDGYYILRGNGVADRTFHTNTAISFGSPNSFTGTLTGWYMDEDRKTTVKVDIAQSLFTGQSLQAEEVSWLKFEATQSAYNTQETFGIVAQETTGSTKFYEVTVIGTVNVSLSGNTGDVYVGGIAGKAGPGTTFMDCLASATIKGENSANTCYVGGIAGLMEGTVENSVVSVRTPPSSPTAQPSYSPITVSSTVTGSSAVYAGGVAGKLTGKIWKNTAVRATVTATGATGAAYGGGFAGLVEGGNINGNDNSNISNGTLTVTATSGVTSSGEAFAGGLAGASNQSLVANHLSGTLNVTSRYFDGASYSGGLVGKLTGGNIENSSINAQATIQSNSQDTPDPTTGGKAYAGGLAGYTDTNCEIKKSSFTNTYGRVGASVPNDSVFPALILAAKEAYAGGIAGYAIGNISEAYAIADIYDNDISTSAAAGVDARTSMDDGTAAAGGIAGKNEGTISDSYAVVTVKARTAKASNAGEGASVGGISGISKGSLTDTFARARVDARPVETSPLTDSRAYAGGIVGFLDNDSAVKTSYAAGLVMAYADPANACTGGIVGSINYTTSSVTAIEKCVALQRYVAGNSSASHHNRVAGDPSNGPSISGAYAYELMKSSVGGVPFEVSSPSADDENGDTITAASAKAIATYTGGSLNWDSNKWSAGSPYPILSGLSAPPYKDWAEIP